MKENYYYEITENRTYKEYPIKFLEKTKNFYKVFFPLENVERELNDNIQFRELTLTNTHLERIGYIKENGKFEPVDGYYLFPQYAIGGKTLDNLSFLFFGYYLVKAEDSSQYWLDYKTSTEKYVNGETELVTIKQKFPGIYNINSLIDKLKELNIPIKDTDSIITGSEK